MNEFASLMLGVGFLFLGIPIGNVLAKLTKDEKKAGKPWFKRIIIISLIIGLVGLLNGNDALMFSMFFISIVTSRSLK